VGLLKIFSRFGGAKHDSLGQSGDETSGPGPTVLYHHQESQILDTIAQFMGFLTFVIILPFLLKTVVACALKTGDIVHFSLSLEDVKGTREPKAQ